MLLKNISICEYIQNFFAKLYAKMDAKNKAP